MQISTSIQLFLQTCPLRKFHKGRIVLYQGEIPQYTFFIKKGVIKAYSITQLGEEKIATFLTDDEVFSSFLPGKKNLAALYYYEALTDCEIYLIPREKLMNYLESNPTAMMEMLKYSMVNYTSSLMRVTALQQPKAQDKIAYVLYHLMQRYGIEDKNGLYEIGIHLTHQTIASYIGLTRETIALELSKLKRKNIISYKNQRYIVDKDKLLNLINEDSLVNYQF